MSIEILLAVALFGFATAVSPGPNNTVLLSLGANFGLIKSLPYINGIMLGLTGMLIAISSGLGLLFATFPTVYQILKWVGFAYILYLAFLIMRNSKKIEGSSQNRIGFIRSTFFQFVNPKAWIVVTSLIASYAPIELGYQALIWVSIGFLVATYPGAFIWAAFGSFLSRWLENPKKRSLFNYFSAFLLVLSMIPVLVMS
jgi:threonine/homoserine/homoserine lactone efflux protein